MRKSARVDEKLKGATELEPVDRAMLLDGFRGKIDEIVGA